MEEGRITVASCCTCKKYNRRVSDLQHGFRRKMDYGDVIRFRNYLKLNSFSTGGIVSRGFGYLVVSGYRIWRFSRDIGKKKLIDIGFWFR